MICTLRLEAECFLEIRGCLSENVVGYLVGSSDEVLICIEAFGKDLNIKLIQSRYLNHTSYLYLSNNPSYFCNVCPAYSNQPIIFTFLN